MRRTIRFPTGSRRLSARHAGISTATKDAREAMKDIEARLASLISNIENATPEALEYALQPIFDESQRLVPVKSGTLKASGFVEAHRTATGATASVGYGAHGDPFYSVYVHERVDLIHESPTQALFLRAAVEKHINDIRPRLIEYLRGAAGV